MRRFGSTVLLLVLLLLSPAAWGQSIPGMLNVRDFGAKGDGQTDDTAAFQKALDAAAKDGGGKVMAPRGAVLLRRALERAGGRHARGHLGIGPRPQRPP